MNSLERVMACIHGTSKDRPAISLLLSLYGAKLSGCNLKKYYTSASEYVVGQQRIIETFQTDIIMSPFALALDTLAFGGTIRFYDNQPPNITRVALSPNESLNNIIWPDIDSNPNLLFIRESVRKLSEIYGREFPIVAPWNGPLELASCIVGLERLIEMLLFDKSQAEFLMEKISQYASKWGNALLDDGANMLVHPATMANIAVVTESMATQIVVPLLTKTYKAIHGNVILHHGGGRIQPLINAYKDLPNLGGFAVDFKDDLSSCRERIGTEILMLGNIEGPTLVHKTCEEISSITNLILENRKDDPHFILGTTSADVAFDTSIAQINSIIQAVKNF